MDHNSDLENFFAKLLQEMSADNAKLKSQNADAKAKILQLKKQTSKLVSDNTKVRLYTPIMDEIKEQSIESIESLQTIQQRALEAGLLMQGAFNDYRGFCEQHQQDLTTDKYTNMGFHDVEEEIGKLVKQINKLKADISNTLDTDSKLSAELCKQHEVNIKYNYTLAQLVREINQKAEELHLKIQGKQTNTAFHRYKPQFS